MRARLAACVLALAALAAPARPAGAEQVTKVFGPLRLSGLFAPMKGPDIHAEYVFQKPGWLRRFSTVIVDENERPADQKLLCHAILSDPSDKRGARGFHLMTVDEGKNEIVFPAGSGPRVYAGQPYSLWMMLQSSDLKNDGTYYFKVSFDVAYDDEGTAMETLEDFKVGIASAPGRPSVTPGWNGDWWVPPGRHEYAQAFTLPYSGTIKLMLPHLHEHATHLAVRDLTSGKTLWEADVANGRGAGEFRIPVYSDKDGVAVFKDHRYEFSAIYDNPLKEQLPAMANIRLFIRRAP